MWVLSICLGSALLLVSLYAVFVHRRMIRYRRRLLSGNTNPEILTVKSSYNKFDRCPQCDRYVEDYYWIRKLCVTCAATVSRMWGRAVLYVGERKPLHYEVVAWLRNRKRSKK